MSNTKRNEKAYIAVATAVVIGLVLSPAGDQGFFAIVLIGPVLTGVAAGLLGVSWRTTAIPWALSGVFFFAYDALVNNEDMGFHAVLTVMMVALVALGALIALIGRAVWRLVPRSGTGRA